MEYLVILWVALLFHCCHVAYGQSRACNEEAFHCLDHRKCVERSSWCNGHRQCYDGSDERYCDENLVLTACPKSPYVFRKCANNRRCVPENWWCDGKNDCPDNSDEMNCLKKVENVQGSVQMKRKAMKWILDQQKVNEDNFGWEANTARAIVALYFLDYDLKLEKGSMGLENINMLHIKLLSSLLRKDNDPLSSNDLASYINALLVTCTNPRNFYGVDLVKTLREQTDAAESNFTNPFILLTLCNAQERLNSNDIATLLNALKPRSSFLFWTEIQALAIMALACVEKQNKGGRSYANEIQNAVASLKDKQRSDGSFNTIPATALAMQAIFASGHIEDDWDFGDAVKFLIESQLTTGSYGDFLTTYYVSPVMVTQSLLNISMVECSYKSTDGPTQVVNIMKKLDEKIHVHYSLWIGDQLDVTHTMTLRVPGNTTFFDIMNLASEENCNYSFLWKNVSLKPYIYAISTVHNDAEGGKFWLLYKAKGAGTGEVVNVNQGFKEFIPEDKDHIIMWYKSL